MKTQVSAVDHEPDAVPPSRGALGVKLALALGFLWAAATAIASFTWPLTADHGVYSWVGDVILRGGVPYRDAWELKGPLGLYLYALVEAVFGTNQWGIRVFDQLANLATLVLVWRMLRRITDGTIASFGALILWLMLLRPGHLDCAQPDVWAGMLVFASIAALASPWATRYANLMAILAGALVGLASLNKFFTAVFLLPLFYYAWRDPLATPRQRTTRITLTTLSSAATFAAALLYLWSQNALQDFFDIQVTFNAAVHMSRQTFSELAGMRMIFLDRSVILVWPLAIYGLFAGPAEQRRLKITLAISAMLGVGLFVAQRKYYLDHITPIYPVLVVLASMGIDRLRARLAGIGSPVRQTLGQLAIVGVILVLAAANARPENFNAWRYLAGHISRTEYYERSFKTARLPPTTMIELCDYVQSHTKSDETVFIWGIESEINYLAERESPSRFGMNYPLIARLDAEVCRRYRAELIGDLERRPPAYILVIDHDKSDQLLRKTSKQHLDEFDELHQFITQHYTLEESQPFCETWRRKAS